MRHCSECKLVTSVDGIHVNRVDQPSPNCRGLPDDSAELEEASNRIGQCTRIIQQAAALQLAKEALEVGISYCERAVDYFSPAPFVLFQDALNAIIKALEGK
ncbi:MAG: hypothetical protein U1E51_07075 [Candidatus Binatia bacterium]|nr:hypothetical protein [Candidatus Binatia bacterium]